MSDINKWSVLRDLSKDFVSNINSVYIYGTNGKQVIVITNDDNVYSFGDNDSNGCLGLGHTNPIQEPTKIEELCAKQVIHFEFGVQYSFVIALTQYGNVYSWGENCGGELGIGNTTSQYKPTIISALRDEKVIDIKSGLNHSLALTKCGDVHIWGNCLGTVPIKIEFENNQNQKIISISCGRNHALALTNDGNVFYCGNNEDGQCGNCNNDDSFENKWCELPNSTHLYVTKIACGPCHSMILSSKGLVYCFGDNQFGQCGDGTNDDNIDIPTKLNTRIKFIDIAATKHYNISIGLSDDGFCYIWGVRGDNLFNKPTRIPNNNITKVLECYSRQRVTYKPILLKSNLNNLILDRISDKFNKREYSDFSFKVEDKYIIYAQKTHLINVCKHFETMFLDSNWIESNKSEIEIKDYSYSVYYAFINYLYTNSVDIKDEEAIELLDLANCYLEEELKQRCVQIIKNSISNENVIAIYYSASKYNSKELKKYCIEYVLQNLNDKTSVETLLENAIKFGLI